MRGRYARAFPPKERREIRQAPVIDVAIGSRQSPTLRVLIEGRAHVLVNERLEIDACVAKRAHDDIGADAALERHGAARIVELAIVAVVDLRDTDLPSRSLEQARDEVFARDRRALT